MAALRVDGIDADFSRCRVRVWPLRKLTNAKLAYIRANFIAIVDELNLEAYYTKNPDPLGYSGGLIKDARLGQGCFLFGIGEPARTELGGSVIDFRDAIPDADNGYLDH